MNEGDPGEPADLVVFHTARTPFEARIVAAVLEDAGIPVFISEGSLADEFASSQRLMNLQDVDIRVPRDRTDAATAALAEARRAGEALAEANDDDDGRMAATAMPVPVVRNGVSWGWIYLLLLLAAVLGGLWLDALAELRAWQRASPNLTVEPFAGGVRYLWKHNDRIQSELRDRNGNGIYERWRFHNRDGVLLSEMLDQDENEIGEQTTFYDWQGIEASVSLDEDQDGFAETMRERRRDGVVLVWRDADRDQLYERLELVDEAGNVVLVQEFRGRDGYVTVR